MIKTLLATTGAVLMTVSALPAAPGGHSFAAARGASPSFSRPAARVSPQYAVAGRGGRGGRYGYGYRGGYYGYGHRYFLYGVPYFYDPFFFGFGYYGGFYGGYPYGAGYGGYGYDNPYASGYYNGRVADGGYDNHNDGDRANAASLPKAVQKQLSQRGYYKGEVDGDFGPASRSALSRFQHDNNIRATGRIDPETMKALGFEDRG